jgi:hypothetical protein
MAGRPPKEKSFANMLNIAIKEAIEGTDKTKLRAVADALVDKAMGGDVQAIKEVADRLDGKVPQGLIGGDENDPPVAVQMLELRAVYPKADAGG